LALQPSWRASFGLALRVWPARNLCPSRKNRLEKGSAGREKPFLIDFFLASY
jgi:hypothetical protein